MCALLGSLHNSSGVAFCLFAIPCPDGQGSFKFMPGMTERPLQSGGDMAPRGHICTMSCVCLFQVLYYNFSLVL